MKSSDNNCPCSWYFLFYYSFILFYLCLKLVPPRFARSKNTPHHRSKKCAPTGYMVRKCGGSSLLDTSKTPSLCRAASSWRSRQKCSTLRFPRRPFYTSKSLWTLNVERPPERAARSIYCLTGLGKWKKIISLCFRPKEDYASTSFAQQPNFF